MARKGDGEVLRTHTTDEGGEPQGHGVWWRPRDPLEGRGKQTNVSGDGNMHDSQKSENMSPKHARIAELAREDKQQKFFSIAHLLTIDAL